MSFYFCSLLEPDYLSHFLCPRWVCRSVQGLHARPSSFPSTPQRLPDGRQSAYLGCQSTLRSPAGVSCTGSSRPWRCQSVWSGSSHYCRTIPETGSSEPWGQHRIRKQKISIKGQNYEMVDCKSCHNTSQLLPSRGGLYSLDLGWPYDLLWSQRLVQVMLCEPRAWQLPLLLFVEALQPIAMWTSPR